ncbi:MAG: hypothetical protein JSV26_04705 [bacterium]|nr:MAG: hypothetical protein JSV26_04705 [bacterium]
MLKLLVHMFLCLVFTISLSASPALAAFELTGSLKVDLKAKTLDTAVSEDGKWTFVLSQGGNIHVLNWKGENVQTVKTEGSYDSIEFAPPGIRLILSGGGESDILVIALDLVLEIDTAGSPSKGPDDAPVVIAYFSDYQ